MSKTTFTIEGRGLKLESAADVQEFIETIEKMDELENVILSGNTFGVEACRALSTALAKKPLLKLANFSDIFTGRLKSEIPDCLAAFGEALKDKKHLEELNLSDNAFGAAGVHPLVEFLTTNRNLQVLKLNNNGLGVTGGKVLAEALMTAHERNVAENKKSSLRVIIAGRNRLENGSTPDLAKAFAAHGTLTHVAMPQNGIRMEGIEALAAGLTKCPGLEILDLQDNTFTERGCRAFAAALPVWTELKRLNFGECLLKNKGTIQLSRALAQGKNTKIESIDFTYAEMRENGVLELASVISNHLPNLSKLELNGNQVDEDSASIDAIRDALARHGNDDALGELDDMEDPESDSDEGSDEDKEEEEEEEKIDDELADLTAKLSLEISPDLQKEIMFSATRNSLNVFRTKIGQSTYISAARTVSGQRLKYSISTKTTTALCSKAIRRQPITIGINHIHRFHASALSNAKVPFLLADIGEGITECEVIQWFVKAGDKVEEFDRLCEVQSDKASVEITSRFSGTIASLKYQIGDMAKVGAPLVEIETGEDAVVEEAVAAPDATSASSPVSGDGLMGHSNMIQDLNAVAAMIDSTHEKVSAPVAEHILTFATPAVRRVAKENSVDISLIKGSGKGGRVMKEDVMAYIANGRQSTANAKVETALSAIKTTIPVGEDKVVPLSMIQKAMFKQMTKSLSIPHFGFADEILLDNATAFRAALNTYVSKTPEKYNFKKVSYMPIFIKALSIALEDFPVMNACVLDGDNASTAKLKYRASHNIGVAMDTPNGLLVPNIKNVQNLSVLEIASELTRLQEAGKRNAIPLADLKDGTLSLSNVGMIGGTYLNPVVVTSEVAIAAVGKMQRLPRFKMIEEDGKLVERVIAQQIVNVSWSADHRVVDGATIARFSEAWKTVVENPFILGAMLR
ncbi:hypothetical protein BGZ76_007967 [Entomortierella beljakovae]|nr:hypothetical protein BGZ76_007967 [Entomortierella beljakovae]